MELFWQTLELFLLCIIFALQFYFLFYTRHKISTIKNFLPNIKALHISRTTTEDFEKSQTVESKNTASTEVHKHHMPTTNVTSADVVMMRSRKPEELRDKDKYFKSVAKITSNSSVIFTRRELCSSDDSVVVVLANDENGAIKFIPSKPFSTQDFLRLKEITNNFDEIFTLENSNTPRFLLSIKKPGICKEGPSSWTIIQKCVVEI